MQLVFRNYNSATSGNDGFTLIELVVVMGIFIVVIIIVPSPRGLEVDPPLHSRAPTPVPHGPTTVPLFVLGA